VGKVSHAISPCVRVVCLPNARVQLRASSRPAGETRLCAAARPRTALVLPKRPSAATSC
jgi:hypothetical protein